MKTADLRAKSKEELLDLVQSTSEKIAQIQFDHARARTKNVKEVRELKRNRARIYTILQEK